VAIHGYHGQYLRIDLTRRSFEPVPIPTDVLQRFIGGSGLGTWLMLRETRGIPDPLAPESPLTFVFSPLVGSPLTTSAKFAVVTKSPLTNRLNDSLSSSRFAIAGKRTGFDAIVITGAASRPTALLIEPDKVEFRDADALWGLTCPDAQSAFHKATGSRFQVAVIGPAGERLVRFATVSNENRHAGRGGAGAVMGAKRLKAVAVRGDRTTSWAHPSELTQYSRDLSRRSLGEGTAKYREVGTISNLVTFNRLGTLPTRNFQDNVFENASALSPESLAGAREHTRESCAACTIGCEHIFHDPGGNSGVRLEYENLFALGPLCGVSDSQVVFQASRLCDELGIDVISAGATIAFAMECNEKGMIDESGLDFGNGAGLLEALGAIGRNEGIGKLLALGTRAASKEIGQGSEEFAPHVKGLEIPGYEPRALQAMALGFAVGSRGADHNRSGAYQIDFSDRFDRLNATEEIVEPVIETENEAALMDSLILCRFLRGVFDDRLAAMAEMLHLVTGNNVSSADLVQIAERIVTAKKLFNIRQGWNPSEDTLPERFLTTGLSSGPGAGTMMDRQTLRDLIARYNTVRGWSDEGWIPDEQIARYQLADFAG